MSNLGIGVTLGFLSGNKETVKVVKGSLGKKITALEMRRDDSDDLLFSFIDGSEMKIWDGGQSCCENRYMHTDDTLDDFVGAILMSIEIKDAPNAEDEWGTHEIQFLVVSTSKGVFTLETHNEHNGYYGGFWIQAAMVDE